MKEITLDPKNWDEIRDFGKKTIDEIINYLESVHNEKIWEPIPENVKNSLNKQIPIEGENHQDAFNELSTLLTTYKNGNAHPKFWGWVEGSGDIYGAIADFFGKGINTFGGFGEHSAIYIEKQVLGWLKEIVGFPESAGGVLTTGSTMANLTGINVARHAKSPFNDRVKGIMQTGNKLIVYCSTEVHNSNIRAIETLGIGYENIRFINVLNDFTMDVNHLESEIKKDLEKGFTPICVVATVGTVNTGAIDPIENISKICKKNNIWLHVDGAFGVTLAILPEMKEKLKYLREADSIAFDFHKWLHVPYEAGCTLIKDSKIHEDTYKINGDYLKRQKKGLSAGPTFFYSGPEMSRSARALKIWFSLKIHGLNKFIQLTRQNLNQAKYLTTLVKNNDKLQLMADTTMNIVCFRYFSSNLDDDKLSYLNSGILTELHQLGLAIPSYTIIDGKYVIRVAIANHRSRKKDFDELIEYVIKTGDKLIKNI